MDDELMNMMRDVLGDMPGFDPNLKRKMLRSLDEEQAKGASTNQPSDTQYFESARPDGDGLCSWDPCPCGGSGSRIPRGTGYVYIPQSAADFRRDCLTERECEAKLNRMADRLPPGGRLIFTDVPVLVCEQGIKKLDIDPAIAAADAKHWWATGLLPLRPTPRRPKSEEETKREIEQAEKKRQQEIEVKERAEKTRRIEEAKRAEEARKAGITSEREARRVCIMCGKPLGFFLKLRGAKQHKECSTFSE